MSDYHTAKSSGSRLGSFELHGISNTFGNQGFQGLGEFGALSSGEQSNIQATASACPAVQSLAAQAINQINRGQFSAANASAQQIMQQAQSMAAVMPQCPGVGSQVAGQIQSLAAREGAKASSSTQQQDSGASAGEVLTGIGSILGAVAGPLSQVFVSHQQSQLQLEQIKQGRVATPFSTGPAGGANFQPGFQQSQAAARGNTNVAIIAIVIGVLVLGAFFMMRSKD